MDSPSAPSAPDYVGAANAQGAASLAAARLNAQLGRVNYETPYGSLTYSNGASAQQSPSGATGGNALPGTGYNVPRLPGGSPLTGGAGGFGSFGGGYGNYGNYGFGASNQPGDSYTATIKLSPAQQQLLDAQNRQSLGLASVANNAVGRVAQAQNQPISTSGLPALSAAPSSQQYQTSVYNPNVTSSLNTSGVAPIPSDLSGLQNQATNAAMARQNIQLNQQEDATRAQLANQGITPGSEAYNRAMQPIQQARVDATNQAFLTGTQYENQLYNQGLSTNAQQYSQALQNAQFGNQAAAQQFSQGLSGAQFGNDARSQMFQNAATASALNNAARGQGIQEQSYLRSLPLNELNALRSGSQVTMPTFGMGGGGGGGGSAVSPGNYQNAAAQQGQWNQNMYANDVSSYNNQMAGAASVASAIIAAY